MSNRDKLNKKPRVDIKALNPLGNLTDEQYTEAGRRAQKINDADDAVFTRKMNEFSRKKEAKKRNS